MIKAGSCFCHECRTVFSELYYKDPNNPITARLYPKFSLSPKGKWSMEAFDKNGDKLLREELPELIVPPTDRNSIPDMIECKFDNNKLKMYRGCPNCQKDTVLFSDCGKYPTYVVALAGDHHVGKTTWLKAIADPLNLQAVNSVGFPYKLDFADLIHNLDTEGAQNVGETGRTNYLRIKKGDRIIATVILMDASGELFGNPKYREECKAIFAPNGEYPGPDAAIFVDDITSHTAIENKDDLDRIRQADETADRVNKALHKALHNPPVAYVYTKVDEAAKRPRRISTVTDRSGDSKIRLFSGATFPSPTSYEAKDLLPRIIQENMIATALKTPILAVDPENRRGFLVKSCENTTLPDGEIICDTTDTFNIYDPLLWLLNKLGIFPIPTK